MMPEQPFDRFPLAPDTPDSVRNLLAVLLKLSHIEVPSLLDYSGDQDFVFDVVELDHPFAEAWQETRDILMAEFELTRGTVPMLEISDSDDCVQIIVTAKDDGICRVQCAVAQYVDGSRTVDVTYSTKDDWEARTFPADEGQERTFINIEREQSLTKRGIESSVATTPWYEQDML